MNATASTATYENTLHEILRLVESITEGIEDKSLAEQVEIGAALHALSDRASKRIGVIKKSLRAQIEEDGVVQGTKHYDGVLNGRATVTCAKPRLVLGKNADVELLKTVLGDTFATYFNEKVTYSVRDGATDSISKIASDDKRDLVLKHVETKESAPRVAFHRK